MYPPEELERLYTLGRIVFPAKGTTPSYKRYLDEMEGTPLQDSWNDIPPLSAQAKERLGYPTQKPLALLERILQASSNPGDVVLDPFCGCGTTVHAAQKLGRLWIGIDITHLAIQLIERRLQDAFPGVSYETLDIPRDFEGARNLWARDPHQFEWWACALVGAQPHKRYGADGGMDGVIFFTDVQNGKRMDGKIITSVKGGQKPGVEMVRSLKSVCEKEQAAIGLLVLLAEPTRPMETEALAAGFYTAGNGRQYPRLQILTIADLLSGQKRPDYFDLSMGQDTFKSAPREQPENDQPKLL